jgi:hypothetical protein
MVAAPKTIHVQPKSELGRLLDEAAETEIILEKEGVRYRIVRVTTRRRPTPRRHKRLEPERIFNIFGIGSSAEGSNIARFKDEYIADAVDHRGE